MATAAPFLKLPGDPAELLDTDRQRQSFTARLANVRRYTTAIGARRVPASLLPDGVSRGHWSRHASDSERLEHVSAVILDEIRQRTAERPATRADCAPATHAYLCEHCGQWHAAPSPRPIRRRLRCPGPGGVL